MTTAIIDASGRRWIVERAGLERVYVAEQRQRGRADGARDLGHALLVEWRRCAESGDCRALLRLACGRLLEVDAAHVCAGDNLAARRLGPRPSPAHRRTA